jgi:hypothetical protein
VDNGGQATRNWLVSHTSGHSLTSADNWHPWAASVASPQNEGRPTVHICGFGVQSTVAAAPFLQCAALATAPVACALDLRSCVACAGVGPCAGVRVHPCTGTCVLVAR